MAWGNLTASQATDDAIMALEKSRPEVAHKDGFSGRALTLVPDNGACFLSRRFHDYAKHFNHARNQFRTPTLLGSVERFHGTLKDDEVY